ncbi:MAG: cardiolipin synthase [Clostridiales bacterium]|nr:cardiolipin synthase [Clostridiales bacterium]
MRKKWFQSLLMRRAVIILILLVEIASFIFLVVAGTFYSDIASILFRVISVIVALYVVSKNDKGGYRLVWVFLILMFPVFGGVLYVFLNFQMSTDYYIRSLDEVVTSTKHKLVCKEEVKEQMQKEFPAFLKGAEYLERVQHFPVYQHTKTQYLSPGEAFWPVLLEKLRSAEKYIFMEYFTIGEGEFWNSILEILKEKARNGVIVRILYDDMGCFLTLPADYPDYLKSLGIDCRVFNPFRPFFTTIQNNRDHRKITSIDGKIAFCGGVNLSDEYVNRKERFGYWKDSALMVEGEAAWSLTCFFLQIWQTQETSREDLDIYRPWKDEPCPIPDDGFVQPYNDIPLDSENVGESVYMHMITAAEKSIYISTPYLILDENMISALCLAAKSGIDVRIVTPSKYDKWMIHMATRSYYRDLVNAGVHVYEYAPGFMHSKTVVVDDKAAIVGSVNWDYRSLYLHFESAVCMCGTNTVHDVQKDLLHSFEVSDEILPAELNYHRGWSLFRLILRLIAPIF